MKRTRVVIGVALAILCLPAAQTVASAIGLGPIGGILSGRIDVAAEVYADVSDAACGYAFSYDPNVSYTSLYACATDDHVRLDYSADEESMTVPQNTPSAHLAASSYTCTFAPIFACTSNYYFGPISDGALSVDPLLRTATVRATVNGSSGPCVVDLSFDTPNGPTARNQQWSAVEPGHSLGISAASSAAAAITSTGSMGGSLCGAVAPTNSWGSVSHGAGLRVGLSVEATPLN